MYYSFNFILLFAAVATALPAMKACGPSENLDLYSEITPTLLKLLADVDNAEQKLSQEVDAITVKVSPASFANINSSFYDFYETVQLPAQITTSYIITLGEIHWITPETNQLMASLIIVDQNFKRLMRGLVEKRRFFSDKDAAYLSNYIWRYGGALSTMSTFILADKPEHLTVAEQRWEHEFKMAALLALRPYEAPFKQPRPLLELLPELDKIEEKLTESIMTLPVSSFKPLVGQVEMTLATLDETAQSGYELLSRHANFTTTQADQAWEKMQAVVQKWKSAMSALAPKIISSAENEGYLEIVEDLELSTESLHSVIITVGKIVGQAGRYEDLERSIPAMEDIVGMPIDWKSNVTSRDLSDYKVVRAV